MCPSNPPAKRARKSKDTRCPRTANTPTTGVQHERPTPLIPTIDSASIHKRSHTEEEHNPLVGAQQSNNTLLASNLKIHECCFLRPHSPGLTAIASTPEGDMLAVARSDYSILFMRNFKLWTPTDEILPKNGDADQSVSCLLFTPCSSYLVASRLSGTLTIYRIFNAGLALHSELRPGGGAIWDMQFSPRNPTSEFRLAVACDDGAVRIISPDPDCSNGTALPTGELNYDIMATTKTQARALSVAWGSPTSFHETKPDFTRNTAMSLVCGDSEGGLRWLCAQTGRAYGHGRIPASDQGPVLIWTLQSVSNGRKVVCGDDRGRITFWDNSSMTMTSEMKPHGVKGAIWCSVVSKQSVDSAYSKDQLSSNRRHSRKQGKKVSRLNERKVAPRETVLFGSANGRVVGIQSVDITGEKWLSFHGSAVHTHDVRGIVATSNGQFMTASVDAKIAQTNLGWFTSALNKEKVIWASTLTGLVGRRSVSFVRKLDLLLSRGSREVEIWHVPQTKSTSPNLLLRMKLEAGSDLRACAISPDCRLLAVSDADSFRLYRIWDGADGKPQSSMSFGKVDLVELDPIVLKKLDGCIEVQFCKHYIVALPKNRMTVFVYDTKSGAHCLHDMKDWASKALFLRYLSCGTSSIAVLDSSSRVFEAEMSDDGPQLKWIASVAVQLKLNCIPTAFRISPSGHKLALTSSDGNTHVFYSNRRVVEEKKRGKLICSGLSSSRLPATSVSFSDSEQSLLASGYNHAVIVSLAHGKLQSSGRKRKLSEVEVGARCANEVDALTSFVSCAIPVGNTKLWCSDILSGGRIALVGQRIEVLQSYLPDAIQSKPSTHNLFT